MFKTLMLATLIGGGGSASLGEPSATLSNLSGQTRASADERQVPVAGQASEGRVVRGSDSAATSGPQPVSSSVTALGGNAGYSGPEDLTVFTVRILGGNKGTQTGYKEYFIASVPAQNKPRPLVVVFHRFGVSQLGPFEDTAFFQEAWTRGWHIVAPLSASGVHFGSPIGQKNTETAIEWMVANFNVDTDRIYGVGFSMGGGGLMSYAARHVDTARPMFAAVVNHTGGVALNNTYINEPGSQFIFDFWFGDASPGSASPWKMAASSLFDFDPVTLVVDTTNDMARNIEYLPTKVLRAQNDPLLYLQVQSDVLASHLATQGTPGKYVVLPGNAHSWDTLSERKTLNWLAQKQLTRPLSGRILADRDRKFFYFTLKQTVPEVFSKLDWNVNLIGNILTVTGTENLTQVEVAVLESGMSTTNNLRVLMDTADGVPVEYVIHDWPSAPSQVRRDGFPSTTFTYDPVELTVTLHEAVAGGHDWMILP